MNISNFLSAMVALSLDGKTSETCPAETRGLVDCLKNAGSSESQQKGCILCLLAGTENSKATTCEAFEEEGFCENVRECAAESCPGDCWGEFEIWGRCQLEGVGCPDICQVELVEIA